MSGEVFVDEKGKVGSEEDGGLWWWVRRGSHIIFGSGQQSGAKWEHCRF